MPKFKAPKNPAEWTAADVVEIDKEGLDDDLRARCDELGIPYKLANGNDTQRSIILKLLYAADHKDDDVAEVDPDTMVS